MSTVGNGYTTRRAFLGGAAVLAAGLAGCTGRGFRTDRTASETVTESFAAPTVRELRVGNRIGDVTVTAVGSGDVGVRVVKRASGLSRLEDIDIRIDLEAGLLTVETAVTDDAWPSAEPATNVTVTVPEGAAGPLVTEVSSGLGDITLLGTRGDTVARTELGDVTTSGADGYLTLRSELGTVLASDVTGLDAVRTEVGDVKVDLLGLRGDVEIGTELGEVVVGVADDLDLDLLVETAGGVDSNLPLQDSRVGGDRLSGRQNAGGHRLRVFSELGEVSLRSITRDR